MRTQRSQPAASQARRLQQGILQHFVQPTVNSVNCLQFYTTYLTTPIHPKPNLTL
jgi:hypothetical protein